LTTDRQPCYSVFKIEIETDGGAMIRLDINDKFFTKKNLIVRRELAPVRERIIAQIEAGAAQSIFYLDMSDIEAINGSGTDEIIAKPVEHLISTEPPKFLVLTNLSVEFEHEMEMDNQLKRRDVAIVYCKGLGSVDFLGKVSDAHREILCIVYRDKAVTARDIADELDKKISLMSTQLASLYKARLIRREEDWLSEGGRQYRYMSLC
jgi:predicted transcriptional regulator